MASIRQCSSIMSLQSSSRCQGRNRVVTVRCSQAMPFSLSAAHLSHHTASLRFPSLATPLNTLTTAPPQLLDHAQQHLLPPIRWLCTPPIMALFKTMTAMQLMDLPLNSHLLCFTVCAAFTFYTLDRLKDASGAGDIHTRSTRARFFTQHKDTLQAATATTTILGVFSVLHLPSLHIPILLPAAALCLLYGQVKQVPGVKTPFLGAMWTLATTILPAMALSSTHLLPFVVAFNFLNTCCICTMADMRDVEGDTKEKVPTIPVALGFQRCQVLITAVCLFNSALCVAVGRPFMAAAPLYMAFLCMTYQPGQHVSETNMAASAVAFIASCL